MTASTLTTAEPRTLADLLWDLCDISPERVLLQPAPGTATEDDLIRLLDAGNKRICELVDGVLVEKPMGFVEGMLATVIAHLLWNYLEKRDLGIVAGADSPVRLRLGLVRVPDVCFISWKRIGTDEVPEDAISRVIPELAVEVLSKSNTAREIARKLKEYFEAGVLLVWVINPETETADVYRSPGKKRTVNKDGQLEAKSILPGFSLSLEDLFSRVRRRKK